ncbi:MAG: hypothetical protein CVV64_03280 [Candidatus Wallbacteria bacterium HGW-Wallbacteria-1]|uniref:DUF83 domain-containing protein n=1 Tax=Candidatus Wallbacteria bacterium HGW-Wallbacteria-1 TaxID=2013854 RepID=A0A2N1PTM8_9BACT|nr:MAG: hypothetical protein CVV64_03280 [Candidatus Wallbacteria bacterium HGW-Wallbacteria-1]
MTRELSFLALPFILAFSAWFFYWKVLSARSLEIETAGDDVSGSGVSNADSSAESTFIASGQTEVDLGFATLAGTLDGVALLDGMNVPMVVGPGRPSRRMSRSLGMKCVASVLLLESRMKSSVDRAVVQYGDGQRAICSVTSSMRADFLRELQSISRADELESRNHCSEIKCIRCPYSSICSDALKPQTPWSVERFD